MKEKTQEEVKEEQEQYLKRQIEEFCSSVVPFGWLDIKAGIEILKEMGYTNPSDTLFEALENWQDSTGMHDLNKIDITYLAYDWINQEVRNIISNFLGFDIQNDAYFEVHGNYMCSSFDFSDEDKEKLILVLQKAYTEDKDNLDYCLSEQEGLVKLWLEYNDINFLEGLKDDEN